MKSNMKSLHERAAKYILVDHLDVVYDPILSSGNFFHDESRSKKYLDLFSFIASSPLGHNHPALDDKDFERRLLQAAKCNPSNSDVLTSDFVKFLETFGRVARPEHLQNAFFVAGGTLAVENALKTAFDWKYKRLLEKGKKVNCNDLKVAHFKNSFHGRSGYSLTLTNTADPRKHALFPKFSNWPRLEPPVIHSNHTPEMLAANDADFFTSAFDQLIKMRNEIAAIIIEPIQGEGGDNHFTSQFHQNLRTLADIFDALLIYDEVQTGVGMTGKMWAHQHYEVLPDIISFGKKMQVCGILAGPKVQEIKNNVFVEKSRLNSTWGGNLVDMVRAEKYLEVIEKDNLVKNAELVGAHMLDQLKALGLENVRGKGLMCAFDMPTDKERNAVIQRCFDNGAIILGCGERSVRVRPSLTFSKDEVNLFIDILKKSV